MLMLQGHDLSSLVTGDDFQLCGQLLLVHNQGMIAGCLKRAGQARKEPLSLMHDGCGFAMHDLCRWTQLRPKGLSDDLKIGRASCRERVWDTWVSVCSRKRKG